MLQRACCVSLGKQKKKKEKSKRKNEKSALSMFYMQRRALYSTSSNGKLMTQVKVFSFQFCRGRRSNYGCLFYRESSGGHEEQYINH